MLIQKGNQIIFTLKSNSLKFSLATLQDIVFKNCIRTHGMMVLVIGSELGYQSSNSEWGSLHFT